MAQVTCEGGLIAALANEFGPAAAAYPAFVGLFTNNHTPAVGDTIADYTELAVGWYAQIALGGWTPPLFVGPYAESSATPVVWTNTDPPGNDVTVYGYFVVDSLGALVWAERDPSAPVLIRSDGFTYDVEITRTLQNP